MKNILVTLLIATICSGCVSKGGRLVSGPLTYLNDTRLEKVVPPRTAAAKNMPLEVKVTSSGSAVMAVDLFNLDGYKNMKLGEILGHTALNAVDTVIEYQIGKTGVHYGNKWFGKDSNAPEKVDTSSQNLEGDNVAVLNTGSGNVHAGIDVTGDNRPVNVAIINTGSGTVDVNVNQAPAPQE